MIYYISIPWLHNIYEDILSSLNGQKRSVLCLYILYWETYLIFYIVHSGKKFDVSLYNRIITTQQMLRKSFGGMSSMFIEKNQTVPKWYKLDAQYTTNHHNNRDSDKSYALLHLIVSKEIIFFSFQCCC